MGVSAAIRQTMKRSIEALLKTHREPSSTDPRWRTSRRSSPYLELTITAGICNAQ